MAKESKLHTDLFSWLRENNLPEKEISRDEKEWFFDIAVGFKGLGMEKPDFSKSYRKPEEEMEDKNFKHIPRKHELGLIDYYSYRGNAQKGWSQKYGFMKANPIQSIDCVCIIGKRAWVLEGKDDPNHTAIGQVLVYSDLFKADYPMFENVKMGIVCREPSPLNEPTCNKLGISIFMGGVCALGYKDSPKIKKEFKYPEPSDNFFIIKDSGQVFETTIRGIERERRVFKE